MAGYSWAISAGGTITAGGTSTSNSTTVTWNTTGAQWIKVNYSNSFGCSAVNPVQYNVTVNPLPVPTISGNVSVCVNSTGNVYTTQTGMTGYTWNVSAGGTITAGTGTNAITVTWNTAGTRTVSVNYNNSFGCTAASPAVFSVTVNPLPVPTLSGPANVCTGVTGNVYTTEPGMTGYAWNVSAGGTITAGTGTNTITVTWTTSGAKTVSINYINSNGCTAAVPNVYNVTVNPLPVPTLTGPLTVCSGATGNLYSTQAGMTAYTWIVSAGGTITAGIGTNTITITWNTIGVQIVSVNYTNANGCTAGLPTTISVTVNPMAAPTLTGPTLICAGVTGNVYTTQTAMINYIWSVSGGGIITAGGTASSNTVTVTWNTSGAQTVSINYTNSSGCTAIVPTVFNVTVNPLPIPIITGPTLSCNGSINNVYSTATGMSSYNWAVSAGGTITSGAGTNSINVSWNTIGAQTVSVTYTNGNGCATLTPSFYNVTVSPMPAPTITGNNSMCVNSGYYTYSTEAGMSNYQWTISAGGNISFGAGTNQVQVIWNSAGSQWVSVNYTNASGCTAPSATQYAITVNPLPGAAGNISGGSSVCAGSQGMSYMVGPIQNTLTYIWTLPAGASIVSGAGTNSITVDFNSSSVSGDITVYGNNLCGNGVVSPSFPVTITPLPATPGMVTGPSDVCKPIAGIIYSVDPVAGAVTYSWSLPPGTIPVAGSTTNSITIDFPFGSGSGFVSVLAANACGNSFPSPNLVVTVKPVPDTPIITDRNDTLFSNVGNGNQWFRDDILIPGAVLYYYVPDLSGEYWDQVSSANCFSDTSNHILVVMSGVGSMQSSGCSLYPVPNDGRFNLSIYSSKKEVFDILIYNNLGQEIFELKDIEVTRSFEKHIDLRPVSPGIYTLIFRSADNKIVKKIMVKP
jgi:hypothetical protein